MMQADPHTRILSLLQKYMENRCDEYELNVLLNWLKSPDNLDEFNLVSDSQWSKFGKNTYPDERRIAELDREVDTLLKKIRSRQTPSQEKMNTRKNHFYRIASILLLLFGLSIGYLWLHNANTTEEISYTVISALHGEIEAHTLADGTHIFLNSGSTLRVPSNFNKENRCIEMTGEGFFDVAPNPEKPFIIKSGQTHVKVLGTSFNMKAYPEDNTVGITVSTGKVLVNIPDIDLQLRVLPMEHLLVNKETNDVTKLVMEENNYTKWMEGILYFDKEPLKEVIKVISRKYKRTIQLRCKNCNPIISGKHDNKSLEAVVDAICFTTGLKSKEERDTIILYE